MNEECEKRNKEGLKNLMDELVAHDTEKEEKILDQIK